MIKIDGSNAIVGLKVEHKNETKYVVKANIKSCYLSPRKDFLVNWRNRPKGVSWKEFCKGNEGKQVNYSDGIYATEFDLKQAQELQETKKKESNSTVPKEYQGYFVKLFEEAKKKAKGKKYKNFKFPIDNKYSIIKVNVKEEKMLISNYSNEKPYFFYFDVNSRQTMKFIKEKHKQGKEIVWPQF